MPPTPTEFANAIIDKVSARGEQLASITSELVGFASTRGNEAAAQDYMAAACAERGLRVDRVPIDVERLRDLPGFSPAAVSYDVDNVVGVWEPPVAAGRSLILNGHIDVVPEGPHERWTSPPFSPRRDGDRLFGRGAGDMKGGLAAFLVALDALADLGYRPGSNLYVQSVVEEECTGNGALACLAAGYKADAALITEPFHESLTTAQVGVIWFRVRVEGTPVHVLTAGTGSNAIESIIPIIDALHQLEAHWNDPARKPESFATIDHPLNLNVGKIAGGDWASSVPAWCEIDCRMGIYPGWSLSEAMAEIESCVAAVYAGTELANVHPTVVFNGFLAEGYALEDDDSQGAIEATEALANAHRLVSGQALRRAPTTATTDARFFGIYGSIPALVYGPSAANIHGFDEWVDLSSLQRVTQTIACFIAAWCGTTPR